MSVRAVSAVLADKGRGGGVATVGPFILGTAAPTSYDCVVYAHLAALGEGGDGTDELRCPAVDFVVQCPRITAYRAAMRQLLYPDWDALLEPERRKPLRDVAAAWTVGGLATTALSVVAALAAVAWSARQYA